MNPSISHPSAFKIHLSLLFQYKNNRNLPSPKRSSTYNEVMKLRAKVCINWRVLILLSIAHRRPLSPPRRANGFPISRKTKPGIIMRHRAGAHFSSPPPVSGLCLTLVYQSKHRRGGRFGCVNCTGVSECVVDKYKWYSSKLLSEISRSWYV